MSKKSKVFFPPKIVFIYSFSIDIGNIYIGARDMAQLVKCWLYKNKDEFGP